MDLSAHSLCALDWSVITEQLLRHARTLRGQRAAEGVELCLELSEVESRYRAVSEIDQLESVGERVPLAGIGELSDILDRAEHGGVLDAEELHQVRDSMLGISRLDVWIHERAEQAPELDRLRQPIDLDAELLATLRRAFRETGELCGRAWPELGALRKRVQHLRERVRSELGCILRSPEMKGILQDHYITERENRLVIPVRTGAARRGLGIVHGTSKSGETLFIEPAAIVARSNEIREKEAALAREVRRILGQLSGQVGCQAQALEASLSAVTQVDLAVARADLGRSWGGTIPEVGESGIADLKQARHPILVLRGVTVVANDLRVGQSCLGLILSGPNTGGKTVALKTFGLCALLVRAGIPIPVGENSRMDLMDPVIADVGDVQTIEGDLSTFSGHLHVLNQVLKRAGPRALILLDEVGVGTDPAQGAALAQAFLEAIVAQGARVVTTTHYAPLRALAAADPRFAVAAVEVHEGQPTYRVLEGQAGASHAFTIARGLQVPAPVVERARSLMDETSLRVSELVEYLEVQRSETEERGRVLEAERRALHSEREGIQREKRELEQRRSTLAEELAAGFGQRLKSKEEELKRMIAAMQEDPGLREAGALLRRVREVAKGVADEVTPAPRVEAERPLPGLLSAGDRIWVKSLGKEAVVLSLASRGRVEVQLGSARMQLKREDMAGADRVERPESYRPKRLTERRPQVSEPVRTDSNTCDLRGHRLEEAVAVTERFSDRMLLMGCDAVFILHGHGTGALKEGLREWARGSPHVRRYRPAEFDEGGDAFTVLYLGP